MSASDASSNDEATFLPLTSITSAVCTIALPAHIAEREPTEAKPVSPCAVTMLYFFWLDAELAGEQARKNCGMALAGRLHVAAQDQLVAAGKRNRGLLHRQGAGVLQHEGHADAAQFFALCGVAPPLVEVGEIRKLQRLIDNRREIAAVVGVDRRPERHRR